MFHGLFYRFVWVRKWVNYSKHVRKTLNRNQMRNVFTHKHASLWLKFCKFPSLLPIDSRLSSRFVPFIINLLCEQTFLCDWNFAGREEAFSQSLKHMFKILWGEFWKKTGKSNHNMCWTVLFHRGLKISDKHFDGMNEVQTLEIDNLNDRKKHPA